MKLTSKLSISALSSAHPAPLPEFLAQQRRLNRFIPHSLAPHNGHTDRCSNASPAKSNHSTANARNPTEDIEWLHGEKEVHNSMIRVHKEHTEHDLSKDNKWREDVEDDLQWGIR